MSLVKEFVYEVITFEDTKRSRKTSGMEGGSSFCVEGEM